MESPCQSTADTTAFILGRRPVLEPVLHSLEPLFNARDLAAQELGQVLAKSGISLPEFTTNHAGVPLLAGMQAKGWGALIAQAASRLLPFLLEQNALKPYEEALKTFFLQSEKEVDQREELAMTILNQSDQEFAKIAEQSGMPWEILDFASSFIISAVLRGLVLLAMAEKTEAPWDMEGVWQYGYCPVCGSSPIIAWLDMRSFDEKNAFLSGGGGKKHLHCALCGANWPIRRGVCPACGKEGEGVVEIFKEKDSLGERIDCCTKCQTYCPTVDLRELEYIPNMDIMALGMIHLDMVAAEKQLKPIKPSFWNIF